MASSPHSAPLLASSPPQASILPTQDKPAPFKLGTVEGAGTASQQVSIRLEFGHAQLAKSKAEKLLAGSIVKLNQLADQPVDIWADGVRIAQAELVVIEGKLCARICSLLAEDDKPLAGN